MGIIASLIKEGLGHVTGLLFGWIKRKHERKMAEHEMQLTQLRSHVEYDVKAQDQRQNTFLDEVYGLWVIGMLTYAMFYDEGLARIQKFDEMPEFIQVTFLLIVAALFGWRTILGPMIARKTGVKMLGTEQPKKD